MRSRRTGPGLKMRESLERAPSVSPVQMQGNSLRVVSGWHWILMDSSHVFENLHCSLAHSARSARSRGVLSKHKST
jgi:hypothetical protein